MNISIENMRIEKVRLGTEDHGIFTIILELRQRSLGIGYGGFALDQYDPDLKKRFGWEYGMDTLMGIMRTVGVDDFSKLTGQHIRVRMNHNLIIAIGHIVEDRWFALVPYRNEDGSVHPRPVTGPETDVLTEVGKA